ncbi:MAG: copper amine oxidase N-terminal domain-containing protein [Clostridia bacterium]|nr:copper amine oxidase N-terminal domain-containing protein [Clostridia bacterium]
MKYGKNTLALVLSGTMLLSSGFAVLAEETADTAAAEEISVISAEQPAAEKASIVQIGDFLTEKENWNADEGALTFSDDKISFEKQSKQMVTYVGQEFGSEVLQFKFSIDFNQGSNWGGFGIRGKSTSTVAWSGNYSYLVVVKQSQIELQRFNSAGNKFLTIVENNGIIEDNKECDITLGSVDLENGVQLFMYVDGELIFNCFDGDGNQITTPGYLSFYSGTKLSVGAYDESVKVADIPAGLSIQGSAEEGKLTADYSILSLTEDGASTPTLKWGKNDAPNGTLTEVEEKGMSDFAGKFNPVGQYPFVETAEGNTYTITEEDENRYIAAYLVDENGKVLAVSDPYYYDVIGAEKNKAIILLVDCENAFVFGEKMQIDPDDGMVVPTVVNDRTLVPIRFISESLGAKVDWEEETETITISLEDTTIQMQLGSKEYTVNGEPKTMDVEATIMRDRTMVPLRVISETFGKNVFWDDKGLIIISDEQPAWDSVEDADIIDDIIEDIQKFY